MLQAHLKRYFLSNLIKTSGFHKKVDYGNEHSVKACFKRYMFLFVGSGSSVSLSLLFFGSVTKKAAFDKCDKEANINNIIKETDIYYDNYLLDNAYNILRKYRSSENPELLWRLARILCEQGKQCKNDIEKKRLFNEAFAFAEKALKNAPEAGCFGAHKWYAIIMDYVAKEEGTKARLLKSMDVKTHLERALEINPLDATSWHILGIWHFTFADMSPYVYMIARAIYTKPPISTYDEALRHFEKAELIKPGFYSANTYYLALTKERLKNNQEALELFKNAFYAPIITVDDRIIHEKALKHLKEKYGLTQEKLAKKLLF